MRFSYCIIAFALVLGSCGSAMKNIQYLNNEAELLGIQTMNTDYELKSDDNVYVRVTGSNPMITSVYNTGNTYISSEASINLLSYTIGKDGTILLPLLGEVMLKGKTVDEAKLFIEARAKQMYKNPAVIVKLVNKSVTVLGELRSPGKYNILKNRITIFEALGLGGDLSDYGDRKQIRLIRNVAGEERMVKLDITSTDIINSEYYWILPNDVIYVPPRNRVYGAKTLPFTGWFGSTMTVISAIISIIAVTK